MADFQRIGAPPSDITGPLGDYLRAVVRSLNDIPQISVCSSLDPNSGSNSGYPGDMLVNVVSTNTDKRLLVMSGSVRVKQTTGWTPV